MILYRNNQHQWELSDDRLVERFLASEYAKETEETLDWRLTAFIVIDLNSTWSNEKAFTRVMERIAEEIHGTLAREQESREVGTIRGGDRAAISS